MESQQQGLTDADISARFNAWHLDQSVSRRVRIAGRAGVWVVTGNPPSSCASLPLRTGVWVGTGHSGEWQWRVKREDGRDGGLVPASIMEWVDIPSPTRARALPDDDEPTIGDLQRELARLRLSRDTWKTRAQKAARRLIDALPDHASCASAELREFRMSWAAYKGFRNGMGDMSDYMSDCLVAVREQTVSQLSDAVIDELLATKDTK